MSSVVDERSYPPSIWAPQPQPSEVTWPKALDTFEQHSRGPLANIVTREDVFGPVHTNGPTSAADIYGPPKSSLIGPGAIGEGRKRNTPPTGDIGDKVRLDFTHTCATFLSSAIFSMSNSFCGR